MKIRDNNMKIFHVHTERCKHASEETEEQYVQKAIQMNASDIYFTDHVPFPGNPFGHRMDMEQLEGDLSSLQKLKHAYKKDVNVHIGLEIEYLPSFHSYYEELHRISEIEIWECVPECVEIIRGVDAHSTEEMERIISAL